MKRTLQLLLIALAIAALAVTAVAQTTATIRGTVRGNNGNPLPDAEVNAVNNASGFVQTVHSRSDGTFQLALTPGTYNMVVAATGYEPRTDTLTVQVGQNLPMDLRMTPTAVVNESITVVGTQAVETKTSEAATNVTPQQMEALPQADRNFLNFAQLAPGVSMSNDPEQKKISANGLAPEQVNVFIDGVSFKNDVLLGGVVGQDSSRGNPFPQSAVQEFRVITQNYSAQYDRAASAVITAVTKSGTNKFDGSAFGYYEPKGWIAATPKGVPFSTLTTNPDYRRYQMGVNLGGPIIRDQLQYFADYEGLNEHAITTVTPGTPGPNVTLPQGFNPSQYAGTFTSPFRSNLAFGKLSWEPVANQIADFSGSYRKESDLRGFGGQTAHSAAENLRNWVYDATARHQWTSSRAVNEASLTWQEYGWNPSAVDSTTIGQNYFGVIRIGGKDTTQDFKQRRIELRDNYTMGGFTLAGQHTLQLGGNVDFMHYDVTKCQDCDPFFNYRQDISFVVPFEAFLGFGNPHLATSNNEYGVFGEDNWVVNPHLNVNLGLRWDYESAMIDTKYVTPPDIVAGLTGKVDSSYFSNGHNRSPFKGEIQPRLGLSYDVFGDSRSIVFGGAGRYYDRLYFNAGLDERFRLQFPVYHFFFSQSGGTFEGHPTIKWDPSFLSLAGLNQLIAEGSAKPEVYLLNNNTRPPYSNQANIGYRQAFGGWLGSVSYNIVRGYRLFSWSWGGGHCCLAPSPNFATTLINTSSKRTWNDAVYLTLDRPYTAQTRWGLHVAYTHMNATQTGGTDIFALDYPTPADYPRYGVPGTEKNRIVGAGILGLPFEVRLSTIVTLGTGQATPAHDFAHNRLFVGTIYPPKTNGFAERNVDLRLDKDFPIAGNMSFGVIAEAFNVFNTFQGGCLDQNTSSPTFGNANCVVNLARRYQLGLKVGF